MRLKFYIPKMNSMSRISCHTALYLASVFIFFSLALPVFSEVPEDIIPPCFTGSEFNKVREWEKTWVGKKVNFTIVDQVKDLLPEPLVQIIKEPTKWGGNDIWFEVVPYRYCAPSRGLLAATKRYSPLAKFDPNGFKTTWGEVGSNEFLVGYDKGELAGFPFPKPKTGIEMAWNYDSITNGDNHKKSMLGDLVNCATGVERRSHHAMNYMYWTGRTDVPPLPKIEPNPPGLRRTLLMDMLEPADMYGSKTLELQYTDPRKEKDSYMWLAMFRKIRRMSTSQRGDSFGGGDLSHADGEGYEDQVNRNSYKFLGVKDMLACRHQEGSKLVRQKGQGVYCGQQRERCKLHLVEVVDKDKGYIYSKEIWYLDRETWRILYKLCWDREGKLWRFLDSQMGIQNSVRGDPVSFLVGYTYVDVQKIHGTPTIHKDSVLGIELSPDIFTVDYLQKTGY
jgi:hypothetical protein